MNGRLVVGVVLLLSVLAFSVGTVLGDVIHGDDVVFHQCPPGHPGC